MTKSLKLHENSLFNDHIMSWSKITLNVFGVKLCSISIKLDGSVGT